MAEERRGLVLGVYEDDDEKLTLTKAAQGFQQASAPKLEQLINLSGLAGKKGGKCRVLYGLSDTYPCAAVVKLGKQGAGYNEAEEVEEGRENVRTAVAAGVKQLADEGVKQIAVDPCGDPEAAAEGAVLCVYHYDDLKKEKKSVVESTPFTSYADNPASVEAAWTRGKTLAEGQNLSRFLMEAPANVMTPTRFAEIAQEKLGKLDNVTVTPRDRAWAEEKQMGCFLGVTRGSAEPPCFLEVHYRGGQADQAPLAVVGKGITFDSGGISIKPSANMDEMRADMGGAACTLASIYTAARLCLPINLVGLTPLCENMPGGRATKPGDVHVSMSGKTVQVDNTDAEGRLVLCDALHYAQVGFQPRGIIDMATLTGAMMVALGSAATGVFTNSSLFWQTMHQAGIRTGDRVWRMPLFKHYSKQMTECRLADLNNIGTAGRVGGSCTAAAFLQEFVTNEHWMHLDIAGVMSNKSEVPYLTAGMAGRPTRTIVEFMDALSKAK